MPTMPVRQSLSLLLIAALQPGLGLAQDPIHRAYPERDALTPFRNPSEIYAPPDRLFALLRRMRAMAADDSYARHTDERGREIVEDGSWQKMLDEVEGIGIDAGYLAAVMRTSRNADDRRTAFYAMFFCDRVDYVLNLISHIPGEPVHQTRQAAFPRAVEYLRVHLARRFGDLDDEQKKVVLSAMPEPGSPAAKAAGITRAPRDGDHLHQLRLVPFIQLLSVEQAIDQAQALWFLEQVFAMRPDLATRWFEPALPRVRQLLTSESDEVRRQVVALLQTIGPDDLRAPPEGDDAELREWAEEAIKGMFPPIRNLNDALIQLFPSEERTALAKAAVAALENSSIGDAYAEKQADGGYLRGFRVARVPADLAPLAIPEGAIITAVNGVAVMNATTLLSTAKTLIESLPHPRKLLVEYVHDGKPKAVEYHLM